MAATLAGCGRAPGAMTFGGWVTEDPDSTVQLKSNAGLLDSVSLFYYGIDTGGGVRRVVKAEDAGTIAWARKRGILVYATIGGTPPLLPAAIAGKAGERCVKELVALCERFGYDGVDVDFEAMGPGGRDPYTLFVAKLASALSVMKRPRRLSVTVMDVPSARDEASTAFDYAALGRLADHVRVMYYDYSYDKPGPLMPRGYFAEELAYARSRIPAEKFVAALPWYGRDWVPATGAHEDLVWTQREKETGLAGPAELMEQYGVAPEWREPEGELTFSYTRDGRRHEVWMPDSRKFAWMVAEVRKAGASGIYVWHLAHASTAHWQSVRDLVRR